MHNKKSIYCAKYKLSAHVGAHEFVSLIAKKMGKLPVA